MAEIQEVERTTREERGQAPPPPKKAPHKVSVRGITTEIFGDGLSNHLRYDKVSANNIIVMSTFRTGDITNAPEFSFVAEKRARLGVFACRKDNVERAAILLLPETGTPDRLMLGITHAFKRQTKFYDGKGWANPLSKDLITDLATRFVRGRWGSQIMASKKPMALLLPVRAKGDELGPFRDGVFLKHVLTAISGLTGDAFVPRHIEAFTFSSGITDLNQILGASAGLLSIEAIYTQDPAPLISVRRVAGASRFQFASGSTGPLPAPGFEPLPLMRWKNEPSFKDRITKFQTDLKYLHDHCMANYTLFLGMQS